MSGAYLQWGSSSLYFDVVTSETHEKSNTITEHPVEEGANITDHVRPNLDRVTLEAYISNTPVYSDQGQQSQIPLTVPEPPTPPTINGAIDLLSSAISNLISPKNQLVANVMTVDSAADFAAKTLEVLDELRTKAVLVSVYTSTKVYDNMLIESCELSRTPEDGDGATFQLELREIRTVSSSVTNAPQPTIKRAETKKNKGGQSTETPQVDKSSILKNAVKFISK